ncbi:LacI family DNA-binding transcriptional regulator [Arcticibacter eurypsychrophilus]|uniref:LacI family DNA-binding transcriptional regulator n=1 Tax=Arcticibacter eurypsychrophilus TaxID=1434752 RepID=UPI00084D9840|nr:substrate-binding domain-containing protein [Arcticibacter eurypsychrophilus]
MKKKKLSINDIAKSLDISATTVSFILNGHAVEKRIRKELVERVLKYVEEVGYKPNSLARSLRTGKSNTIGLMVEDISNPYFSGIARFIEENAYKNGYKIIYSSTDNDPKKTKDLIQMFRERHVDGYIISAPVGVEEDINELIAAGLPVVQFDRVLQGVETDAVEVDNSSSTYNAIKHLIDGGFKNIGFVTLISVQSQMLGRLQGYKSALSEHDLKEHVMEIPFSTDPENNINHILSFLENKKGLDAVLFGTNYLAISGLKAIKRLGLTIPDDLAVIAFDDHDLFELSSPTITAITQPIAEIANEVITILLKKLNSDPLVTIENQSVVLPTSMIIRGSSKKIR